MAARRREAAAGAQLLGGGGWGRRRAVDGVLPAGAVAGRGGDGGGGEGGEGEATRGGGRAGARRRGGPVERRCGRGGGAGRGVPRAPRHHGQWPRREVDSRALQPSWLPRLARVGLAWLKFCPLLSFCSADDWKFAAEQFVRRMPDKVIVHRE